MKRVIHYHEALVFQYGNVYVVTPNIRQLYEDEELQRECVKFVSKSG